MKLAILCHIYYPNIWRKSIEPKLSNITDSFDLYLSICNDINGSNELGNEILSKYPNAHIDYVPNLGEDVRGFFTSLKSMFGTGIEYDYVLKIHTKSEDKWREDFLNELIVSYDKVRDFFIEGKSFVASKEHYSEFRSKIKVHHEYLPHMLKMCGCQSDTSNHFSGTMFWVKYSVLKKYFGNNQILPEYFDQKYAKKKTKQHSAEILFGCIAKDCGNDIGFISMKKEQISKPSSPIQNVKEETKPSSATSLTKNGKPKRTMSNPPRPHSLVFKRLYRTY